MGGCTEKCIHRFLQIKKNMTLTVTQLVVGQMAANCYIASDRSTGDALILDPGDDAGYIIDTIARLKVTPVGIILTHGHFDHCMAAFEVQMAYEVPCMLHPADMFLLTRMAETAKHFLGLTHVDPAPHIDIPLGSGQYIAIGESRVQIHEIPGHTPGSVLIYHKESPLVFVGDVLFDQGAVGRTDHEYSSPQDLATSIRSILSYSDATRIYAGHGESTTVGLAKTYRPVA